MTPSLVLEHGSRLMEQWNLKETGWMFRLNTNKRRLGVCRYKKKTIEVSRVIAQVNPDHIILDTIKHEIAHALVGPGHGHGIIWKQKAIIVGCEPKACCTTDDFISPQGKWSATCTYCNKTYHRYKAPHPLHTFSCRCRGKLVFTDENGNPPPQRKHFFSICGCNRKHVKIRRPKRQLLCRTCRKLLTWEVGYGC